MTYEVRDAELNEPVIGPDGKVETFKGWVDGKYQPAPSATPVPACWSGSGGGGTQAPAASVPPDAVARDLVAQGFAFDIKELQIDADKPFAINLDNQDPAGVDHNVQITETDGTNIADPDPIDGGTTTTYVYEPLPAGTYTFICRVHPIAAMTGTLTVK